ncbi:MAG: hypothetical protein DLM57_01680 [Pseudonocardiales bacterium]|nr:MAG: hypothetical protein DLM57_01680 [Pseudonocardiales bacterium]
MAAAVLSDAQIAALSPRERQQLMTRLARPAQDLLPSTTSFPRLRRRRLTVVIGATVALIPWTVYLGLSLPERHVARNWSLTWVGFDALLLAMFAVTAVLGIMRRQLLVLAAFASGILLVCDAWFDITTAGPGELWLATGSAALLELPIAVLLINSALRLIGLTAARLWLLEPGSRLWQLPLLMAEPSDGAATGS